MVITATGGNGGFQTRDTTNGVSASYDSTPVVAPPYWVKMERSGGTFTGYVSPDGKTWTSARWVRRSSRSETRSTSVCA